MNTDVGLKDAVVEFFGQRQIGQKHGQSYASEQQNALEPWLFGEPVTLVVEIENTLVPGVYRN